MRIALLVACTLPALFLIPAACSHSDTAPAADAAPPSAPPVSGDGSASDAAIADAANPTFDAGRPFPGAAALPKFVTPLPIPPVFVPRSIDTDDAGAVVAEHYAIDVRETWEQVLPEGYAATKVYAYGAPARSRDGTIDPAFRGWPSATFEATRGVPVDVAWTNALDGVTHMFPVDPTIHWADPTDAGMAMPPFPAYPPGFPGAQSTIPLVAHLHGGEVASSDDGYPLDWVPPGKAQITHYPNAQPGATLWYHDHALGMTRLNVLAGLAGFYLLRDPSDAVAASLPSGDAEIPIVIQDRAFDADGALSLSAHGTSSVHHPYWIMEYSGDVIVVNGRTWPNLDVTPRQYRFRILDGSNARFYRLRLVDDADAGATIPLVQIGSDGGYLPTPVTVGSVLLSPGERADVVVDLSTHPGAKLRFVNDAPAPFPNGTAPDPATTGQILQLTVASGPVAAPTPIPTTLATIPALTPDAPPRTLTLVEPNDEFGQSVTMLLNGTSWDAPATETPRVGSTEDWALVNLGDESHPIHLHLAQFQIVSRRPLDAQRYLADWTALNGSPDFPIRAAVKSLDPASYFTGPARAPEPGEGGWKDTAIATLGEVTTIRVRIAPTTAGAGAAGPGKNLFPFDPTKGPGYVWHCHILEHEDNEMMRPLVVSP